MDTLPTNKASELGIQPKRRRTTTSLLAAVIGTVAFVVLQLILAGSQAELGILYIFIFAPLFFILGFLINLIVSAILYRFRGNLTPRNLLIMLLTFDAICIIVFTLLALRFGTNQPV